MAIHRDVSIDILKAFCIVLVVIGHYNPATAPLSYSHFIDFVYTFHMPAFMWASGFLYILTKRDLNYLEFQKQKALRLLLPYLIVSIIIISLKLASAHNLEVDNPVSANSYLNIFFKPEAGYFLWFIWALTLMFLIVPFFRTTKSHIVLLSISIILSPLSTIAPSIFSLDSFFRFLPFFAFGMCCADMESTIIKKLHRRPIVTFSVLFLFSLFASLSCFLIISNENYKLIIELAEGLFGILMVYSFSKLMSKAKIPRLQTIFSLIAAASFTIYLFHTTFQGFIKALLSSADTSRPFFIDALIVNLTGCLGPFILHYCLLSKFKLTRLAFSIKSKKPTTNADSTQTDSSSKILKCNKKEY